MADSINSGINYVILAAGRGTRLWPVGEGLPKCMVRVLGKPLVEWVVDAVLPTAKKIVIVVGYNRELVVNHFKDKPYVDKIVFAVQEEQLGTAHALLQAEPFVDGDFVTINGDSFADPSFYQLIAQEAKKGGYFGVSMQVDDARPYGLVHFDGGLWKGILEKPRTPSGGAVNLGNFFLPREFFGYVKKVKQSSRGEYEVTDALAEFFQAQDVRNVEYSGFRSEVTYFWNYLDINIYALERLMKKEVSGKIEEGAFVDGLLHVGKGSIVKAGTRIEGPVFIGENCVIGPNAFLRSGTVIENNCHIGTSEIKNSVIMSYSNVPHFSFVGDSVLAEDVNLGAGSMVADRRFDRGVIDVQFKQERIVTGKRKLGCAIGKGTRIGANVTINCGVLIGHNCWVYPRSLVKHNLDNNSIYRGEGDITNHYHRLAESLFKAYDCRGKYGRDVTEENFYYLGMTSQLFGKRAVIGMDYRQHNDVLARSWMQGFEGEEVRSLGFAPTPAVAFCSGLKDFGVSFTASHNPVGDNGAKIMHGQRPLFQEELARMKGRFEDIVSRPRRVFKPVDAKLPEADIELLAKYVDSLPEVAGGLFDLCGGAACSIAGVFKERIFDRPDPLYERHAAEPKADTLGVLREEALKRKMVGFAFDGDADRLAVVDDGKFIDGGVLGAFIASRFMPRGSKVLVTIDNSDEVYRFLQDEGFNCTYSPVGDVFLARKMLDEKVPFAFERSGHYSFAKHMSYSDGIYAGALLSGVKPGEIAAFAAKFMAKTLIESVYVQVDFERLAVAFADSGASSVETMDGVKARFENYCILVRASNTEPKIRINVEAASDRIAGEGLDFAKALVQRCVL